MSPEADATGVGAPVDMLVVTTRQKATDPGEIFSGDRAKSWTVANIVVSIPPESARKIGDVQWPRKLPGNPATDFVTTKVAEVPPGGAIDWYKRVASRNKRVFIFVHGFNNTFEEAVYRFAQIVHDSHTDAAPVLFTWPSRGSVFDYVYDKESATYSRNALEAVMTRAASDPNVSDVTVMAHSMGNWVLAEALRQMAIRRGRILPKIHNVIMAAPDIDVDVFRSDFGDITGPRPRFTIFVSQDDRALAFSRRIGGDITRLGAINPNDEPYKSEMAEDNIVVIDLTKLKSGDSMNHGKFAESPAVVKLIGERLIAGQTVTDANLSVGERITQATLGATSVVGSTVGAVVSAPIAVVDPNTRRAFGRQVNNIGDGLSSGTAAITGQ